MHKLFSYSKKCNYFTLSSPRPWGCFRSTTKHDEAPGVFPTPVGVFLGAALYRRVVYSLPHARGGVSKTDTVQRDVYRSSPRPWGCFSVYRPGRQSLSVFPTPVGVFPKHDEARRSTTSLPHARGGVSVETRHHAYSPPVFPTPVGVFLKAVFNSVSALGLPHARGGVSYPLTLPFQKASSSPRPWGCF